MNLANMPVFCPKKGCVLFDLDGTLLDTAPDIMAAANQLLSAYNKSPFTLETLRPIAGEGTRFFIEKGMGHPVSTEEFIRLKEELFAHYRTQNHALSQLFPAILEILSLLNETHIPWGIVTNKPTDLTLPLLTQFPILKTAQILVCADTLAKAKPHPEPILHACDYLQRDPLHSVYIGDHERDAIAGKAAGLFVIVAMYGYIRCHQEALTWPADFFLPDPIGLFDYFTDLLKK
jgi:N-acetyl-D-muramate 6-phosphate phosphatase